MEQTAKVGVVPVETLLAYDGLDFLQHLIDGRLPVPPIAETLGFALTEVAQGRALVEAVPQFRHYNPIGVVHAGFAATLLDTACGCAVHSTLKVGERYTTLELKFNMVRSLTKDTGRLLVEGRIVHRGRTIGTAEAFLRDEAGRLYAHATSTIMIFPAKSAA